MAVFVLFFLLQVYVHYRLCTQLFYPDYRDDVP